MESITFSFLFFFFFFGRFFFFGVIQFAGDIPSHRQSTTVLKGREKGDYENNKD